MKRSFTSTPTSLVLFFRLCLHHPPPRPLLLLSTMPSVMSSSPVPTPSSPPTTPRSPVFQKKKFRTVFGIGGLDNRPRSPASAAFSDDEGGDAPVLITTAHHQPRQPSVTDDAFFADGQPQQQPNTTASSSRSSLEVEEMKIDLAAAAVGHQQQHPPPPVSAGPIRSMSRPNFRITPQWGPWTVSVAETPNDTETYNIYIKSTSFPLFFVFLCVRCMGFEPKTQTWIGFGPTR